MNLYRVCNLIIQSAIPLPELAPVSAVTPDYRFSLLPVGESSFGEHQWFNQWVYQDQVRLKFALKAPDYLLRFTGLADFLVPRDGQDIKCQPLPDTTESTVRHLLLDSVIPLILSRREQLVLHASAILTQHGAIAFIGTSGQGKSTLAASHGRRGFPLISDDYLVVRQIEGHWIAVPSYPGVRLLPESSDGIFEVAPPSDEVATYTAKRRVSDLELLPFADRPAKLLCLYVLDEEGVSAPPEPAIERFSARQTFLKLVNSSFNLDTTDKALLRRQFATLGSIVADLPCFRLRYPREFATLPAVSQLIADHQEEIRCLSR